MFRFEQLRSGKEFYSANPEWNGEHEENSPLITEARRYL